MRPSRILVVMLLLGAVCRSVGGETPSFASAEPAEIELTLEAAIGLAMRNSRSLTAARLTRGERKLELDLAEDGYRPQLDLTLGVDAASRDDETADASLGWRLRVPTGGALRLTWDEPLTGEDDQSSSFRLGFSQPLLKGFGADVDTASLRKARLQERIDHHSLRDQVAGVVTAVIGACRSVVRAQQAIRISRASLERARNQLEINRSLIRAGRLAAREIVQTEAEVADRELALIESENVLASASASLVDILDIDDGTRIRLVEELEVEHFDSSFEQSIQTALARRGDHLEARLNLEAARIDLRVAKNSQLWDLQLDAGVSGGGGDLETGYQVGLSLNIPLSDRAPTLELLRARNGLRRAEMALAESRQAIRIEVRRGLHDVQVGLRRIELARRSRELAEQKLDFEQKKLAQGLTSTYRLTQVEDDLVRAQSNELDATLAYLNARTALDRTLGATLERWGIEVEGGGES